MTNVAQGEMGPRKATLAAVAADHVLRHACAATSMSEAARAAGLGKAALSHRFAAKPALFVAAFNCELRDAAVPLRDIAGDATLTCGERIGRALEAIHDACIRSAVGRRAPLVAQTSRIVPEVARGFHDGSNDAVRREMAGARDGAFRAVDPVGFHPMVFGPPVPLAMSRAMFAWIADPADLDMDRALASHREMPLDLLRPAGRATRDGPRRTGPA